VDTDDDDDDDDSDGSISDGVTQGGDSDDDSDSDSDKDESGNKVRDMDSVLRLYKLQKEFEMMKNEYENTRYAPSLIRIHILSIGPITRRSFVVRDGISRTKSGNTEHDVSTIRISSSRHVLLEKKVK
jgi:hypothetical protein